MAPGCGSLCATCGLPLGEAQAFCPQCGTPRPPTRQPAATRPMPGLMPQAPAAPITPFPLPQAITAQPAAPSVPARTGQAAAAASRASGVVAQMAGFAGMGFALPWQTVAGGIPPDIRAFLSMAALPGAQRAIRASLKRPGLALAVTTALDLAVAAITGGTGALYKAIPRFVLGGSTSLLSLVTGSKGGQLRKVTGALAAVTTLAQLGFALYTLIAGIGHDTSALVLVPQLVTMTSSLVMAVKTAIVAFRRP